MHAHIWKFYSSCVLPGGQEQTCGISLIIGEGFRGSEPMVSLKQSALWSLWPMIREMPQRMLMTSWVSWICLLIPYCKQTNKNLFYCHSVYARLSTKFSLPSDEEKWLGLWEILDLRRKSWWGQTGPCLSRGSGSLEEGLLPMGEMDICPYLLSTYQSLVGNDTLDPTLGVLVSAGCLQ